MSTPNFCYDNIIIAIDDDRAETWDIAEEPMLLEDLVNEIGGVVLENSWTDDRSYPGSILWEKVYEDDAAEYDYGYKVLQVIIRSGYYVGANLDYRIIDDDYREREEDVEDIEKKIRKDEKKVRKILKKYGTELICRGTFSNGEAVYEKKR